MWPQVAPARESRAGQGLAQATVPSSEQARMWQRLAAWRLAVAPMGDLAGEEDGQVGEQGWGLLLPGGHSGTKGIREAVARVWVGQAATRAALRAEPTALSLLCLRAAGWRSCPRLGPACLSSPAPRSWGPRSRARLEAVAAIQTLFPHPRTGPALATLFQAGFPRCPLSASPGSWKPGGLSVSASQDSARPWPGSRALWVPFATQAGALRADSTHPHVPTMEPPLKSAACLHLSPRGRAGVGGRVRGALLSQ